MRCKIVQRNLTAYLDGELDPGFRERLEGHLDACSSCREEKAKLEVLRSVIMNMEIPSVPDELSAQRILETARAERPRATERWGWKSVFAHLGTERRWLRPAFGAGVLSVLCALLLWQASPLIRSLPVPSQQEILVVEKMELFEHLELLEDLTLLEWIESGEYRDGETG